MMEDIRRRISGLISESIPIAGQSMGLQLTSISLERAELFCPIAPNANDKGTGFAGSIYSSLVLSGWALAMANACGEGMNDPWAAVARSETRYYRPLTSDFKVIAEKIKVETIENRRRIQVTAHIVPSDESHTGRPAVVFSADYIYAEK